MLTLAHPWWLALSPLVLWLALRGTTAQANGGAQLVHPDLAALADTPPRPSRWRAVLLALAALLLLTALAQPQWLGPAIPEKPEGRDLMLLVDTSSTMSIDDFELDGAKVSRLDVLKGIAKRFVAARQGDRFGLIAFGKQAATLVPPSFDTELLAASLDRLQIGIAGEATAIGDALGLAVKQVQGEGRLKPALILFSDGDNTAGDMRPAEAIAAARALDIKVFTVMIGTDLFARGNPAQASEPDLQQIARGTGGKHYTAGTRQELERIIADIGKLTPSLPRPAQERAITEWYWLPLLAGVIVLALLRLAGGRERA